MPHPRLLKYWRSRVRNRKLEYFAQAPTPEASSASPDLMQVQHSVSAVFERGTRVYAFCTQRERDDFVMTYRTASICDNPWP